MRSTVRGPRALGLAGVCIVLVGAVLLADARLAPTPVAAAPAALGTLPPGWPSTLQLGMADSPGGAAALKATAPFGFRYQYLAGGVNTGNGWATWNTDGQFVTFYVQDSVAQGITPVFTYYMIRQSNPGSGQSETDGVYNNLQNAATMTAYYNDLKLFFQRAGAFPSTRIVLHVEPDLWGYMQQRATNDDAATVPAQVASTGLADVAGLPNTVSGFARAVVRLRDSYAPNVWLAYHVSIWGTGIDILYSKPSNANVTALGNRAAAFFSSLQAAFDLAFGEFSDRDAAFKQFQYGDGGASWYAPADFARHVLFFSAFTAATQKRVAMWQIPLGNTKLRAMNNTWNHYQDNVVEWLLDEPARTHLDAYLQAGVIAFLFGRGADGATCACDAAGDGVTNPAPINGNTSISLTADDDGGFFRQKAAAYYTTGAISLPTGLPSCAPRPPVGISVVPQSGQLRVTVTAANTASAPGNVLLALHFQVFQGALVDLPSGQQGIASALDVPLAAGTTLTQLTIRRAPGAQSATLTFAAEDLCGYWQTFAGGGPSVFGTAGAAGSEPSGSAPSPPGVGGGSSSAPSGPPPAAPAAVCAPRPRVRVATQPIADGGLTVTVASDSTAHATLQALRFGAATNARIDAAGRRSSGAFHVTLPTGTAQTTFTVAPVTAGQAVTVPVTVIDSCGDWPTLIGAGAGA